MRGGFSKQLSSVVGGELVGHEGMHQADPWVRGWWRRGIGGAVVLARQAAGQV
jgi:hypothetical protein